MPYRFHAEESLPEAIQRCSAEQLDGAIAQLTERIVVDPASAVHAARRAVKRERSLLRLTRATVPAAQRQRDSARLRDAARELSDARDAEVMSQTLQDLAQRYVGQLPQSVFTAARTPLRRARDVQRARFQTAARADRAARELAAIRARMADRRPSAEGWPALGPGLMRTYRRGVEAMGRAGDGGSVDELHAWRKRVKDLWYQLHLLSEVGGPTVRGQAKDAHALGDLLGDDHDLAVLRHALVADSAEIADDLDAVLGLIDHRRRQLQRHALHLGARVYAESAKRFARRIRRCWEAGQAEARVHRDDHPPRLHTGRHAIELAARAPD